MKTGKIKGAGRIETSAVGIMSGTSLDGLDLCFGKFIREGEKWHYTIVTAETIPYPAGISNLLSNAHKYDARSFTESHILFGKFCGEKVKEFIRDHHISPEFCAFHGHTIFHEPKAGLTFQIGSGAALSVSAGIPVICDFRSQDVALNGQGAPLVPAGDELLFPEYDACLNLGGFANISFRKDKRLAFDICPVNFVLNGLAMRAGKKYDPEGSIAASGKLLPSVMESLNSLDYYSLEGPKSLGREWVEKNVDPVLTGETADLLRTITEHSAFRISEVIRKNKLQKVLVTGGGAFNSFLTERIRILSGAEIILPPDEVINFKEALIFAFLGVLRWHGENNVLKEVTGAEKDHCAGAIYF